jgi:hypothetical protein
MNYSINNLDCIDDVEVKEITLEFIYLVNHSMHIPESRMTNIIGFVEEIISRYQSGKMPKKGFQCLMLYLFTKYFYKQFESISKVSPR